MNAKDFIKGKTESTLPQQRFRAFKHFFIQALLKYTHSTLQQQETLCRVGSLGCSRVQACSHLALSVSRGNGARVIPSYHIRFL